MIIDKTVRVYLDPDNLEEVMDSLGRPQFDTEAWCEYEELSRNLVAKKFLSPDILPAMRKNLIDFVVFKLNC